MGAVDQLTVDRQTNPASLVNLRLWWELSGLGTKDSGPLLFLMAASKSEFVKTAIGSASSR